MARTSDIFLRLGTRGSPLALAQAQMVRAALAAAHGVPPEAIAVEAIRTSGDRIQDRPLAEAGGKGLFTKEIEEALLERRIDLAVHSSKDMPTVLPDGLTLAAFLPREDARDAFVSRTAGALDALAKGARVGTSSLRRAAMVRRLRPDLVIVPMRGNVETRLRKLDAGEADATLLALAGLKRLGLERAAAAVLSTDAMLPAVGQGAVGIEARTDDARVLGRLAAINHVETAQALEAERAFLAVLDGSCRTPIGGHATVAGGRLRFQGLIVTPDGRQAHAAAREGSTADAAALGADAGAELKRLAGPHFFAEA